VPAIRQLADARNGLQLCRVPGKRYIIAHEALHRGDAYRWLLSKVEKWELAYIDQAKVPWSISAIFSYASG
jgi:hypothetical protein